MQQAARSTKEIIPPEILREIGLSAEELAALAVQGFVSAESRGRATVYKLRFRCGGRQCVRYLGADAAVAARVREELITWQRRAGLNRALARLRQAAHRFLRHLKVRLEPILQMEGYQFHGLGVRKRRNSR